MVDRTLQDERFLERVEQTFNVDELTESRLQDWLLHRKDKRAKGLSSATKRLARRLSETRDVYIESQKGFDITQIAELESLKNKALASPVYKDEIIRDIDEKLEVVKEEEVITKQIQSYRDKVDKIKSLSREERRDLYKFGDKEERILAGIALGETSYQTLGGLVRGEQRRVQRGIRLMF